jgi:arylsulfatase A-like enzyme
MIIKLPGAGPEDARVERAITGLVDVLPLLVEELQLPIPPALREQIQGINPLREQREFVLAEKVVGREAKVGSDKQWALMGDRWSFYGDEDEGDALFDLWADPYEVSNVFDDHPSVSREMHRELARRIREDEPLPAVEAEEAAADSEHLEELRTLGYVD